MSAPTKSPLQLAEDAYAEGTPKEFGHAMVLLSGDEIASLGDFIAGYLRRVKQEVRP